MHPRWTLWCDITRQIVEDLEENEEDPFNIPVAAPDYSEYGEQDSLCLLIYLTVALLRLIAGTSRHWSGVMLKAMRTTAILGFERGAAQKGGARQVDFLSNFPVDSRTIIKRLELEPTVEVYVSCPTCWKHYASDMSVKVCISSEGSGAHAKTCGTSLIKVYGGAERPLNRHAYQRIDSWLQALLNRNGMEDLLDQSLLNQQNESGSVDNVWGSRYWRTFLGPDKRPFTIQSGNLVMGLFIDWFNPFGNKIAGQHVSTGAIIMVVMNLPVDIRHKPENVCLISILPGCKEPDINQANLSQAIAVLVSLADLIFVDLPCSTASCRSAPTALARNTFENKKSTGRTPHMRRTRSTDCRFTGSFEG